MKGSYFPMLSHRFLHSGPGSKHEKECALAHSRAERGRLRHVSASRECVSSRSVFCFIGRNSYEIKKDSKVSNRTGF